MAMNSSSSRSTLLVAFAGPVLMVIFAWLVVVVGGHNGQPSSQNGPGNVAQTDQGRNLAQTDQRR
jgi:hypothetical protein